MKPILLSQLHPNNSVKAPSPRPVLLKELSTLQGISSEQPSRDLQAKRGFLYCFSPFAFSKWNPELNSQSRKRCMGKKERGNWSYISSFLHFTWIFHLFVQDLCKGPGAGQRGAQHGNTATALGTLVYSIKLLGIQIPETHCCYEFQASTVWNLSTSQKFAAPSAHRFL